MAEHHLNMTLERLRQLPVSGGDEAWEIGVVDLPAMVQDEGDDEPWHPTCSVCVSTEGGATMSPPARPAEVPASSALDALALFALKGHVPGAEPLDYLPARVLVSSMPANVHAHFVAAMSQLDVRVEVKERLPNLENFLDYLTERVETSRPIDAPPILKCKDMTVDRVRAFAEAAALFWDAEPWMHFPGEVAWVIEPRPRTRVLRTCLVMGAGGEEFGLAFLSSPTDLHGMALRAMIDAAPVPPRGTVWSMTFVSLDEAPFADAELWLDEAMPLAAPEAFPLPMGLTEAGNVRRPTCEQLALMETLLRGFAAVDAEACARDVIDFTVSTYEGPATLRLQCGARL